MSRRFAIVLFWLALAASAPVHARAQSADAAADLILTAEAAPSEVTVGDEVTCTLRLDYAPDVEILGGHRDVADTIGKFFVKRLLTGFETEQSNERKEIKDVYAIATFVSGDYEIPPFQVRYHSPRIGDATASTQPIKIRVKSVLSSDSDKEDISDIAPPVTAGKPGLTTEAMAAALGAIVLFAALLGALVWWLVRKRPAVIVPPRPAWELALERFGQLRQSEYLAAGSEKTFASIASDILREYLQTRHGFLARDMTTEETLQHLHNDAATQRLTEPVREFLYECDRIKFARHTPPDGEKTALIDNGIAIIEMDVPAPQAATAPADNADGGNNKTPEPALAAAGGDAP